MVFGWFVRCRFFSRLQTVLLDVRHEIKSDERFVSVWDWVCVVNVFCELPAVDLVEICWAALDGQGCVWCAVHWDCDQAFVVVFPHDACDLRTVLGPGINDLCRLVVEYLELSFASSHNKLSANRRNCKTFCQFHICIDDPFQRKQIGFFIRDKRTHGNRSHRTCPDQESNKMT